MMMIGQAKKYGPLFFLWLVCSIAKKFYFWDKVSQKIQVHTHIMSLSSFERGEKE